jgi:hypothetical protein
MLAGAFGIFFDMKKRTGLKKEAFGTKQINCRTSQMQYSIISYLKFE